MSFIIPSYRFDFYSGSTLLHRFGEGYTNKVSSWRIKPGLTTAIGSFEVEIPDTGSNATGLSIGTAFANIDVYNIVYCRYNTSSTLSENPQFVGLIDTKKVEMTEGGGFLRTFTGRDAGEALFRILERRFSLSAVEII